MLEVGFESEAFGTVRHLYTRHNLTTPLSRSGVDVDACQSDSLTVGDESL